MGRVIPFEIRGYRTESGKKPYLDWLHALRDEKTRSVIRMRVQRLKYGNLGDCKRLEGGVYELRIHYGPGFRVYFGRIGNTIIVLLCGGDKRTQKSDVSRARLYWSLYEEKNL